MARQNHDDELYNNINQNAKKTVDTGKKAYRQGKKIQQKMAQKKAAQTAAKTGAKAAGKEAAKAGAKAGSKAAVQAGAGAATGGVAAVAMEGVDQFTQMVKEGGHHRFFVLFALIPFLVFAFFLLPILALLFFFFPSILTNSASRNNLPVAMNTFLYQKTDKKTKEILAETLNLNQIVFITSRNASKQQPIYDENQKVQEALYKDPSANSLTKEYLDENSKDIEGDGYMGQRIVFYADAEMTKELGSLLPGTEVFISDKDDWDGGDVVPISVDTVKEAISNQTDRNKVREDNGVAHDGVDDKTYATVYMRKGNLIETKYGDAERTITPQDEYDMITLMLSSVLNKAKRDSEQVVSELMVENAQKYDKYGQARQGADQAAQIYAELKGDGLLDKAASWFKNIFTPDRRKEGNGLLGAISHEELNIDKGRSNVDPYLDGFDPTLSKNETEGGVKADGVTEAAISTLVASYAVSKSDTLPNAGYFKDMDNIMKEVSNQANDVEDVEIKSYTEFRTVPTYVSGTVQVPKLESKRYFYYTPGQIFKGVKAADKESHIEDLMSKGLAPYRLSLDKVIDFSNYTDSGFDQAKAEKEAVYAYVKLPNSSALEKNVIYLSPSKLDGIDGGDQKPFYVVEETIELTTDGTQPLPVQYPYKNHYVATELVEYSTTNAQQEFFLKSPYYRKRLEELGVSSQSSWLEKALDATGDNASSLFTTIGSWMDGMKSGDSVSGDGDSAAVANSPVGRATGSSNYNLVSTDLGNRRGYVPVKSLTKKQRNFIKKNAIPAGGGLLTFQGYYLAKVSYWMNEGPMEVTLSSGQIVKIIPAATYKPSEIDPTTFTKEDSYFDFVVDDSSLPEDVKNTQSFSSQYSGSVMSIKITEEPDLAIENSKWKKFLELPYYPEEMSYLYAKGNAKFVESYRATHGASTIQEGKEDEYGNKQYFFFPTSKTSKASMGLPVYTQDTLPEYYDALLTDEQKQKEFIAPIPNWGQSTVSPVGMEADDSLVSTLLPWHGHAREYRRSLYTEEKIEVKVARDGSVTTTKAPKSIGDKIIEWQTNIRENLTTKEHATSDGAESVDIGGLIAAEVGNPGGKKYKEFMDLDPNLVTTRGNAWSAAFASYVYDKLGASGRTKKTSSVSDLFAHHKGDLTPSDYKPQVGDMVFISSHGNGIPDKVAIVQAVAGDTLTIVSGDEDGPSATNANNEYLGTVVKRDLARTSSNIVGIVNMKMGGAAPVGTNSVASNNAGIHWLAPLYSWESLPDNLKSSISIPMFQEINWATSPFQGDIAGQCTELTWAYMTQLWGSGQPTLGHGGVVYKSYEAAGATITQDPTVGYGFSTPGTSTNSYGHTGVVLAVYEDGSWLAANFNMPGTEFGAPSRKMYFTHYAGTSPGTYFFSGVGNKAQFTPGQTGGLPAGSSSRAKRIKEEVHIAQNYVSSLDNQFGMVLQYEDKSYRFGIGQWTDSELGAIFKDMKAKNEANFTQLASANSSLSKSISEAGTSGNFTLQNPSPEQANSIIQMLESPLGQKAQMSQLEKEGKEIMEQLKGMEGAKLKAKPLIYLSTALLTQKRLSNDRAVNLEIDGLGEIVKSDGDVLDVHVDYYRNNQTVYKSYERPTEKGLLFEWYPVEDGKDNRLTYLINQSILNNYRYSKALTEGLIGDASSASGTTLEGSNNIERGWRYLKKEGYSDESASAILGNMIRETAGPGGTEIHPELIQSGHPYREDWAMDPSVDGYAFGSIQWDGGRRVVFLQQAKSKGADWKDFGFQLEFMTQEFNTTESYSFAAIGGLDGFKRGTNIEELTLYFQHKVERGGFGSEQDRIDSAKMVYNTYKGRS